MNRLLAITRQSIPYIKELRPFAKSVTGCILMQQLDYWFEKYPSGFFKFLEPCEHDAYKKGKSWTEELGMSSKEFRTAFDNIGVRYGSKGEYDEAKTRGVLFEINAQGTVEAKPYCSYHDKIKGVTYYFRNDKVVDALLDALLRNRLNVSPVTDQRESTELTKRKSEYKDKESKKDTTKDKEPCAANADAVDKPKSDHILLMDALQDRDGIIPDGGKQGRHIKQLLTAGFTVAECVECLDALRAQDWRDTRVDWCTVAKEIGTWRAKKNGASGQSKSGSGFNQTEVGSGGTTRDERRYAELRRQTPELILGTPTASNLD